MNTLDMLKEIDRLADIDCDGEDNPKHDHEHCVNCRARMLINDLAEELWYFNKIFHIQKDE